MLQVINVTLRKVYVTDMGRDVISVSYTHLTLPTT